MNLRIFNKLIERIPIVFRIKIDGLNEKLKKSFSFLSLNISDIRWVNFSFFVFFFSLLLLWLFLPFLYALGIALFISSFLLIIPMIEAKNKEMAIEGEIPLFLRNLGVLINIGIPFISALKILSRGKSSLSNELKRIVEEALKGGSIPKLFSDLAEKVSSLSLKRAFAQVIVAYEHGTKGFELKQLADELLNKQRHKIREYASKSSLLSLLFIMISVVGPTFYILLSIIQPVAFSTPLDENMFGAFLLVVFPTLSFFLLLISKMLSPPSTFSSSSQPYYILIVGIVFAVLFLLFNSILLRFAIAIVVSVVFIYYFINEYMRERKKEEIEKNLADALLIMASMPKGTILEKMFEKLSKQNLSYLSQEFKKAYLQLKANAPVEMVIEDLKKRVGSSSFSRVMDVLLYTFKIGGDVNERIAEMAEDVLSFVELKRERNSLLSLQKYSLIFGVVLMALVIANAVKLSSSIASFASIDMKGIAISYIPSYLLLSSSLVAWFCSSIEGKSSSAVVYFVSLSLVSIAIFYYFL